jgi:hypothetical protein
MTRQDQATQDRFRPKTSREHYLLEVLGILCFVLLLLSIGVDIYHGMINFDDLWIAPILAVLAADFLSGFVHFLANNSGHGPLLGPVTGQLQHDSPGISIRRVYLAGAVRL